MISNLRNFAKTGMAKILMVIIIIPFVFWGMGGVFSSGSTNSIAKINNYNISTQDLVDHLNEARLDLETIKQNIDNNVLEELLGNLVSNTLIQMEIEDLNIYISEKILIEKIKKNKAFLDNQNKFSRTKYEKFLLLSNMTAPDFEIRLKKSELQKNLFSYISGGIKSPFFITNKTFKEQTKKLDIKFSYVLEESKFMLKSKSFIIFFKSIWSLCRLLSSRVNGSWFVILNPPITASPMSNIPKSKRNEIPFFDIRKDRLY